MNEDFKQYVYARIEKALNENEEYMKLAMKCGEVGNDIMLQNKEFEDLTCQLECIEQELCYMRGFNDAMQLIHSMNSIGNK